MLPTDHEHLLWLYERGRILDHAPPADEDLGDPAEFEPIYLSTLEHVAAHAESDQDRLSALFLLAEHQGYEPHQDRLLDLSEATASERVKLTALHLLARAFGLLKRFAPTRLKRAVPAPRAPSAPSARPPAPPAPRIPTPRAPALPWPRLPIPRRRAGKHPKPIAANSPATAETPSPSPPIAAAAPLPSPLVAAGSLFPSPPIAGGDTEGGFPIAEPTPPLVAAGSLFPSPSITAGSLFPSPPIVGGDTEGGSPPFRFLPSSQPKPNRRKRRRAPPKLAVA